MYDDPQRHRDGRGERQHPSQHIRPAGVNIPVVDLQVSVVTQIEDVGDLKRVVMVSVVTGVWLDSLTSFLLTGVFMRTTLLVGVLTDDDKVFRVEMCFSCTLECHLRI